MTYIFITFSAESIFFFVFQLVYFGISYQSWDIHTSFLSFFNTKQWNVIKSRDCVSLAKKTRWLLFLAHYPSFTSVLNHRLQNVSRRSHKLSTLTQTKPLQPNTKKNKTPARVSLVIYSSRWCCRGKQLPRLIVLISIQDISPACLTSGPFVAPPFISAKLISVGLEDNLFLDVACLVAERLIAKENGSICVTAGRLYQETYLLHWVWEE